MHELSICRAIASKVEERSHGRTVASVRLRIGHFRQVIPETLAYCWELQTRGTTLDSSILEVDHVPAVLGCDDCEAHTELTHPALRCGHCDSTSVSLVSGEEFFIESIELGD